MLSHTYLSRKLACFLDKGDQLKVKWGTHLQTCACWHNLQHPRPNIEANKSSHMLLRQERHSKFQLLFIHERLGNWFSEVFSFVSSSSSSLSLSLTSFGSLWVLSTARPLFFLFLSLSSVFLYVNVYMSTARYAIFESVLCVSLCKCGLTFIHIYECNKIDKEIQIP